MTREDGELVRVGRPHAERVLQLGRQRGDRGESVQRGGALQPVRDDEQLVDAAGAFQRGRRAVEGGHRVPRLHQEDGAEELLLGRLGHSEPQFVASLNRDRLRVSSSASFTRSSTVRRVWSTACSVCTATSAMERIARTTPSAPRTCCCDEDRKSTRLNSSHRCISYAVFCLTLRPPRSSLFPYTTLFRSRSLSSSPA